MDGGDTTGPRLRLHAAESCRLGCMRTAWRRRQTHLRQRRHALLSAFLGPTAVASGCCRSLPARRAPCYAAAGAVPPPPRLAAACRRAKRCCCCRYCAHAEDCGEREEQAGWQHEPGLISGLVPATAAAARTAERVAGSWQSVSECLAELGTVGQSCTSPCTRAVPVAAAAAAAARPSLTPAACLLGGQWRRARQAWPPPCRRRAR